DRALKAELQALLPESIACRSFPAAIQEVCRRDTLLDNRRWQQALEAAPDWQAPCAVVLQKFIARYFGCQRGVAGFDSAAFSGWLPAAFFAATVSLMQGHNTALLDALV